jgi:hypothetical protein
MVVPTKHGHRRRDIPSQRSPKSATVNDGKRFVKSFNTTNVVDTELVVDVAITTSITSGDFIGVPSPPPYPRLRGLWKQTTNRRAALGGNILFGFAR